MKSVFSRQGVLKKVRSDNASYFVSSEFQTFACSWGFKTATSSPRYAQSDGLAERSDKDSAFLSYRATPLKSGYSPSELMFCMN